MALEPLKPEPDLLAHLADPGDAALRARVLADLLHRPDDDPDLVEARKRIPRQSWIKATVAAQDRRGTWGRSRSSCL